MKKFLAITLCSLPMALASSVYAQTTPATPGTAPEPGANSAAPGPATPPTETAPAPAPGGMESSQMGDAITGTSIKNDLLGKTVYNEKDEKVGDVNDVILSSDGTTSYFIVGAGGFIGMGEHNVAIPYDKISATGDKMVLQGYTKEQLKEMPAFKPAKTNAPR